MVSWFIPIVVDNLLGYALDQSTIGERIREKFNKDDIDEAFFHALEETFEAFKTKNPFLATQDSFCRSFTEANFTSVLVKLLLRDKEYDSDALAQLWADALYSRNTLEHGKAIISFSPIAGDFLQEFDKNLRKERVLREIYDSQAFEKMTGDMNALVKHLVPPQLSDEVITNQCKQYCQKLYNTSRMLDFKGIQHVDANRSVVIPLVDVFVFPDVYIGVPEYETIERDELAREGEDIVEKQKQIAETSRQQIIKHQVLTHKESIQVTLTKHRRLVILGDPGSGKSTLLKYLMLVVAQEESSLNEAPQLTSLLQGMSPVYIPLSTYAETWLSHDVRERSLQDFLPRHLHSIYLGSYCNALQSQLEDGRLLVLLDGLDEIPDASLRMQVVRQIEAFTLAYPQNIFIVTSRIVGYKDAPLAVDYQACTLADFSKEQIKTFTQKWCPAYEYWVNHIENDQLLNEAATKEAEKLFQATQQNEGVKRLAVNPLLLTILALIQRQGINLPSHRVELYDLCVTTLLETWLRTKGSINQARLSKREIIQVLRPLAFWMHEHRTVGAIPEEELLAQIVKQLLERKVARSEEDAWQRAEQFIKMIREQTGILVERGRKRYGFLHQTFEEYFAALELKVRRKDRNNFIKTHIHNPRWQVVILLTVGIIGIIDADEDEVTELVQNAILKAESPFEHWLHRDLLFAGICLADDIGMHVELRNVIIQKIVLLYLTSPYDQLRAYFTQVLDAWKGTSIATNIVGMLLEIDQKQNKWRTSQRDEKTISLQTVEQYRNIPEMEANILQHHEGHLRQHQEYIKHLLKLNIIVVLSSFTDVTNHSADILKACHHPDWRIQLEAIRAWGKIGIHQRHEREVLFTFLSDSNLSVREAAILALGKVKVDQSEVIQVLLALLADSDASVRRASATALGRLKVNQPEVIQALLTLLSDFDAYVRQVAIFALERLKANQPEVIQALLTLLSDPNYFVRQAATSALEEIDVDQSEIIKILDVLLTNSNLIVQKVASIGLELMKADQLEAAQALLSHISDPNSSIRWLIAYSLGQLEINQPEIIQALLTLLTDPDFSVRRAATIALGQLEVNQPGVAQALLTLLTDSDFSNRWEVGYALGQMKANQPEVIQALLTHLADSDASVRRAAASALGRLEVNQPEIIQALLTLLTDSDFSVRQAATSTLGQLEAKQPEVIQALLTHLADPDASVRRAAASALGRLEVNQPEIIQALLTLLTDSDFSVRQAATFALERFGKTNYLNIIQYLTTALEDESVASQLQQENLHKESLSETVLLSLRGFSFLWQLEANQPEVIQVLLTHLADPDASVRRAAASALGQLEVNQPEVIQVLLTHLADPDASVRRAAASALGQLEANQPEVIQALLALLSDSSIQWEVGYALQQMKANQPEVIQMLLAFLSDPNASARRAATSALERLEAKQPEVIQALLTLLTDSDSSVRRAAISALGQLEANQPEVIRVLLALLTDSDSSIQWAVGYALQQMKANQPEVIQVLLTHLADPDASVRRAAASALGQLEVNQPEVIQMLFAHLADPDASVRQEAASALGQLNASQPEVIQTLLALLSDPDASVRQEAASALGQLEANQPEVIQTLLALLSDFSTTVRWTSASALGQLNASQPEVVQALLIRLSDSSPTVRQTVTSTLTSSPAANLIISEVARMLMKYEPIVGKQLLTDNFIDNLISILYRITGEA